MYICVCWTYQTKSGEETCKLKVAVKTGTARLYQPINGEKFI